MDKKKHRSASSNSSDVVRLSHELMQEMSELTRDSSTYNEVLDSNINTEEDVSESDDDDFLVKKSVADPPPQHARLNQTNQRKCMVSRE